MLPDVTILCDFMLHRVAGILDRLHVYPERMQQNMAITRGLIFSQAVLLALTRAGMPRDDAYEVVQQNAMRTWDGEADFRDLLAADKRLLAVMDEGQLAECFDPRRYLGQVDGIFRRVFEES
jgi:adenylosuccinate lyase